MVGMHVQYVCMSYFGANDLVLNLFLCISFSDMLYFCSAFGCTECLLLSTMAYDRYLAICYPLHYLSLMRSPVFISLSLLCWLAGLLGSLLPLLMVSKLVFCGPHEINHFFSIESAEIYKGLSLLYTVFTPMLNPIIYSLRNSDIHKILRMKTVSVKMYLYDKLIDRSQLTNIARKGRGQ
ncbi:olfactory receptor 6P1-like [Leptodactylus fuscus]